MRMEGKMSRARAKREEVDAEMFRYFASGRVAYLRFRASEAEVDWLRAEARLADMSVSGVIRLALRARFEAGSV